MHNKINIKYCMDLIVQKTQADLKAEASRGYLGVLWWILEPVMYMGAFYFVFTQIRHRGDKSYVMFLLTGLIAWKWFHTTITGGSNSLLSNAGLMNQVYLPKIIFPISTVAVNTFKFFIILSLFLVFLQIFTDGASLHWGFLPFLVIVQFFLILSLTCFLSAVMPFFPDFKLIIQNIMMILLFLSGIFYDITKLPERAQKLFFLNPMASLIQMYRNILLEKSDLDWNVLLYIFLGSFVILMISTVLFYKFDRLYPKIVRQ